MMGALDATKHAFARSRVWLADYLANDDPYAAIANTGAFIVWSNQPLYPLYVAWIAGHNAWPSLATWVSTPLFAAVPVVARRHSLTGRSLFVIAGLANTVLSIKAFGEASGVSWFLIPCLIITLTFFRSSEWRVMLGLSVLASLCALTIGRLGAPFHLYTYAEYSALTKLNIYSVTVLSLYLIIAAIRVRLPSSQTPT